MSVRSDRLLKGFVLLLLLITALVPASFGLAQTPQPTPAAAGTPMATPATPGTATARPSPAPSPAPPRENLTLPPAWPARI
jgi:hypothetical protein